MKYLSKQLLVCQSNTKARQLTNQGEAHSWRQNARRIVGGAHSTWQTSHRNDRNTWRQHQRKCFLHYRLDILKPWYLGNIQSHIKLHLIPNHLFDMSKTSCQFERLMCSLVFPYRIKSWNTCSRLWGSFNENLQRQKAIRKHRANKNHIILTMASIAAAASYCGPLV